MPDELRTPSAISHRFFSPNQFSYNGSFTFPTFLVLAPWIGLLPYPSERRRPGTAFDGRNTTTRMTGDVTCPKSPTTTGNETAGFLENFLDFSVGHDQRKIWQEALWWWQRFFYRSVLQVVVFVSSQLLNCVPHNHTAHCACTYDLSNLLHEFVPQYSEMDCWYDFWPHQLRSSCQKTPVENRNSQTHQSFLSQKPINDNHLDQVDESWYLNETRDKTSPGIHLRWNMFLIWDQTLAFAFLLYHFRELVKNWTSYFITRSKHLETNESRRPIASCFHLSLGVWNPWWSTCPRSWHITSNTVWLQTSQRFCFFFFFSFSIFLDRGQVKVHVSVNFRLRSIHCACTFLNDSMVTVKIIIPWPTPKKSQDCKKTYLAA